MSCGIYADRPAICRSVPFMDMPRGSAFRHTLNEFVSKEGYECETGPEAPLVIKDAKFVSEEHRDARARLTSGAAHEDLKWIPKATARTLFYFEKLIGLRKKDLASMYGDGAMGTGLGMPFGWIVYGMLDCGAVDEGVAVEMLQNQIDATDLMMKRYSAAGFLGKAAPAEAVAHALAGEVSTWEDYLSVNADTCGLFIKSIDEAKTPADRVAWWIEGQGFPESEV